jgi:hypothetical protein
MSKHRFSGHGHMHVQPYSRKSHIVQAKDLVRHNWRAAPWYDRDQQNPFSEDQVEQSIKDYEESSSSMALVRV